MFTTLERKRLEALIKLSDSLNELSQLYLVDSGGDQEIFDELRILINRMRDEVLTPRNLIHA